MSAGPSDTLLDQLAKRFAFHASIYGNKSAHNASPLYAHLSEAVAPDRDILELVVGADLAQQVSNLLFGAVHFLLLNGTSHPLAQYYASLTQNPLPPEEAYRHFRAFCLQHAEEVTRLVTTRRIQTNEVQRCTGLIPAFHLVSLQAQGKPLFLLEIGPSAGLNLLWDRYGYDYGEAGRAGDPHSPVQLTCALRGPHHPPVPATLPTVAQRTGIDLNPVSVHDQQEVLWLRALIWPEHKDRAHLFEQATALARRDPPQLIRGNAVDELPALLRQVPSDVALCIFHSYTLNQCPAPVKEGIESILAAHAEERDLFRVSLEWYGGQTQPHFELHTYRNGSVQKALLAYCESHGREIEWLL